MTTGETKHNQPAPKKGFIAACLLIPVIASCGLLALVAVYYAAGFILTAQLQKNYANRDCVTALSLGTLIHKFYPEAVAPFVEPLGPQVAECQSYLTAAQHLEQGEWEKAYESFRAYLEAYPEGLFAQETSEKMAQALLAWGDQLCESDQYDQGVQKFQMVIKQYGETTWAAQARKTLPAHYVDWGRSLRAAGDFAGAEKVLKVLQQWVKGQGDKEHQTTARLELAQVYVDWAGAWVKKGDFAEALRLYTLGIDTDPNPYVKAGPASQMRAVLSDVYLQWAESLLSVQDFNGALEKIESARVAATKNETLSQAEEIRQTVYQSFSQSTGDQAQAFINDVGAAMCSNPQPVDLPMVALDDRLVRIFVHGHNFLMPPEIAPSTPASLHYVACITNLKQTVQSCPYDGGYTVQRIRYTWAVRLYEVLTGNLKSKTDLNGSNPPACNYVETFTIGVYTKYKYGNEPAYLDLQKWLSKFVK